MSQHVSAELQPEYQYQESTPYWCDEIMVAPLRFLLQLISSAKEIFRMQTQDAAASGAVMGLLKLKAVDRDGARAIL